MKPFTTLAVALFALIALRALRIGWSRGARLL